MVFRPLEDDTDRLLLKRAIKQAQQPGAEHLSMRFGLSGQQEQTQKEVADY
jgi:RNA polymerase sporulation-specific sigma factor